MHYQPCAEAEQAPTSTQTAHEVKLLEEKLSEAIAEKEVVAQRCHELDMQVQCPSLPVCVLDVTCRFAGHSAA